MIVPKAAFAGLPFAPYDPALRFDVPLAPAQPRRLELPTADDGAVPLHRIGTVTLGELGPLDVWWLGGYQDTSTPDYREPGGGWRWVTGEPWGYTR